MNTTTAAATAKVSTTTIRTWCRIGAIAAVKTAGRWVIDARSLKARLVLGRAIRRAALKRRAAAARTRILAALPLPQLTGTDKQIAWADDLRARRIDAALTVAPWRLEGITYRIGFDLGYAHEGTHTTEADALAALTAALEIPSRSTAKWWIDMRYMTTPAA